MTGQCLLFFHESSCNICHNELSKHGKHWQALVASGMTLISIDCNVATSPERGWNYNIIDSTGAIYLPCGAVKIPTYILIDENNVVIARKSTLEDIEKFMKL